MSGATGPYALRLIAACVMLSFAPANLYAQERSDVMRAMRAELQRSTSELKTAQRPPPYFVGYWVVDYEQIHVRAQLGALVAKQADSGRRVRVELRVGSHELDNSNYLSPNAEQAFMMTTELASAPLVAGVPLRRTLWLASDSAYRSARELFDQKQAERRTEIQVEEHPGDFSKESLASVRVETSRSLPERTELVRWVEAASREFVAFPEVYESEASAEAWLLTKHFVSSEGVESYAPETYVRFVVSCVTQAPDGMPLAHDEAWFGLAHGPKLQAEAKRLAQELSELRQAELIRDYSGPVLFEGLAGAQITQELLASSLSGTPGQQNQDGPLARRLGKRVFPKGVNVYDDPTITQLGNLNLVGHYAFDDEAVPAARVDLVEDGRLRALLMSRTPRQDFAQSNGHGRSGLSGWAAGGVGNLVVESTLSRTDAELRARMLKAVRDEGGEYGLVIRRLERRGFATSGVMPPAAQRVYKLFPDGREELVRGASLGEMSVRDLRDLLGVGQKLEVFNYAVVWPTGLWSPSSVVAPSLLFEEVEVNRPKGAHARPPALPRPAALAAP